MRHPLGDIIKELETELAIRRKAYPQWIAKGRLSAEQARRKMELMEDAIAHLRSLQETRTHDAVLDALLTQRVRELDAQGKARIITSREIQEVTGLPPRRLGAMMTERGWQRVWVAHGVRGWLLPWGVDAPSPVESSQLPFNTNANTVEGQETAFNTNANTVEDQENAFNTNANSVDNTNANTVEGQEMAFNTNGNTVDNSNANTVEAQETAFNTNANTVEEEETTQECDHRLLALADLNQMDDFAYVALARQMLERVKGRRLCARCSLVAGSVQVTQLETAARARQRIAAVVSKVKSQFPASAQVGLDPMDLIDENYRAVAQFVLEHLASRRLETFMRLCDALERQLPREKRREASYLLSRLAEQAGFQQLVKVERKDGEHILNSVWVLREPSREPSLFSPT